MFSIKDFFSKYDQIWSHLLKKSLMENFLFCAVLITSRVFSVIARYDTGLLVNHQRNFCSHYDFS